jgi:hypothetical protein
VRDPVIPSDFKARAPAALNEVYRRLLNQTLAKHQDEWMREEIQNALKEIKD